jgi:hypothetical protein
MGRRTLGVVSDGGVGSSAEVEMAARVGWTAGVQMEKSEVKGSGCPEGPSCPEGPEVVGFLALTRGCHWSCFIPLALCGPLFEDVHQYPPDSILSALTIQTFATLSMGSTLPRATKLGTYGKYIDYLVSHRPEVC